MIRALPGEPNQPVDILAGMVVDVAAPVLYNRRLSPHYNVIALGAPSIAAEAEPGQFVMVKPAPGHEPLLRRPFSVFEVLHDGQGTPTGITLLNQRVGITTRQLFDAEEGQRIPCLGPLGRPFSSVDPGTDAWMVAGGVGLAPFATLATALEARGVPMTLFYGGRSAKDLFYTELFERAGAALVLATEDGTRGEHGRVTVPLERALSGRGDRRVMLFACGPEPMLAAVAHLSARYSVPCEVSVERVMGCGLGGCYSCVVPVRGADGRPHYVRSCVNGPVFDAAAVIWD
jgi:dihydroorotate dehydrogenase electron transfer subunit